MPETQKLIPIWKRVKEKEIIAIAKNQKQNKKTMKILLKKTKVKMDVGRWGSFAFGCECEWM